MKPQNHIHKRERELITDIKSTCGHGGIVAEGLRPANPKRWLVRKRQYQRPTDFWGNPIQPTR